MDLRRLDRMPSVGVVMTPFPYFANPRDPIDKVRKLMTRHGIHHVPVLDEGRVVGVISDRDLRAAEEPGEASREPLQAASVLTSDPYVVDFSAPLAAVVTEMAERHIGSAIVVRKGKLAGILSVTDVCRVLAQILLARFPGPGGTEAA